ncbi:MAG: hypothetical protein J5851_08405 [Oscillospiraceae bacterium]|nr:hypothetical protein [Oscillospiraceae bacterium]
MIEPDGLYTITIPIADTSPGDTITVRYSTGKLNYNGGDDRCMVEGFTAICLGCRWICNVL